MILDINALIRGFPRTRGDRPILERGRAALAGVPPHPRG